MIIPTARPFRLDGVDTYRVCLPLAEPLVTSRGRYLRRELVLLRVRIRVEGLAQHGWGEAAPLPGWNDSDLDDLVGTAQGLRSANAAHTLQAHLNHLPELVGRPALRFGFECGALDALCRIAGLPLAVGLAEARGAEPASTVPVQRTLGDCDADRAIAELTRAHTDGYTHAKLKVGAREARADLERIRAIAAALPDMTLRLDANGAWGVDDALDLLATLPNCVEWVEQPVADGALDRLLERYDGNGPAIAADESCVEYERAAALIRSGRLGALVVKPAALGGLQLAGQLFELAQAAGVAVIISNLMESSVGRAAVAHLAAAWPGLPGPHGLATGAWFARDVADEADSIRAGRLSLRPGAGLGFDPVPD